MTDDIFAFQVEFFAYHFIFPVHHDLYKDVIFEKIYLFNVFELLNLFCELFNSIELVLSFFLTGNSP
jgi:hypothetical protein